MPRNTLTFRMEGRKIQFSDFTVTMSRLQELLQALSQELAPETPTVQWELQGLPIGSVEVTLEGSSVNPSLPDQVSDSFVTIGHALSTGQALPFSKLVCEKAEALTSILKGSVRALAFETDEASAFVSTLTQLPPSRKRYALGELQGTVQTLTKWRQRRFVLYDALFHRAVDCFFTSEWEETVRGIWGHQVSVTGRIGRDSLDGHPIEMRDIREIHLLSKPEEGFDFNRAFGILDLGDESPEVLVRRLRDAE